MEARHGHLQKKGPVTLRKFETKIVRCVYGPVTEDDECRIRNNQEIDELLNYGDSL